MFVSVNAAHCVDVIGIRSESGRLTAKGPKMALLPNIDSTPASIRPRPLNTS